MTDENATTPDGPRSTAPMSRPITPGGNADYAGAIYGSLLAASTIVGVAASGTQAVSSIDLLLTLVVTSLVFWLMHVYVRVLGSEVPKHVSWVSGLRSAARRELPILVAVIPPALVIVAAMVLDEPGNRIGWGSLLAALGGMVVWTWLAVRRVHARRGLVALSMIVSFALGMVLVLLKAALGH